MKQKTKVLVVFSGGMDSTALLSYAEKTYEHVIALSFFYGQRHAQRELEAAKAITEKLGVQHMIVNAAQVFSVTNLNTALINHAIAVPDGLYDEKSMAITVVPGRNLIFLSIAASVAEAEGCAFMFTGVHAGDHAIYADCRQPFIRAANEAISASSDGKVFLQAPFVYYTKSDIVDYGVSFNAPFELSWSCYKGGDAHCGTCGTCTERIEAFYVAGVPDPTTYAPGTYDLTIEQLKQSNKIR